MFDTQTKRIPNGPRRQLIEALQKLGPRHAAERARARLNLSWDDLIIPASEPHEHEHDDETHQEPLALAPIERSNHVNAAI
jgi:hypothetical protein